MLPEVSKAHNIADILSEEFNKFKLDVDQGFKVKDSKGESEDKSKMLE